MILASNNQRCEIEFDWLFLCQNDISSNGNYDVVSIIHSHKRVREAKENVVQFCKLLKIFHIFIIYKLSCKKGQILLFSKYLGKYLLLLDKD